MPCQHRLLELACTGNRGLWMLCKRYRQANSITNRHACTCAEVASSDAGTATRLALLAVRGGGLLAVPIGTRLPLLRILLGGADGSL